MLSILVFNRVWPAILKLTRFRPFPIHLGGIDLGVVGDVAGLAGDSTMSVQQINQVRRISVAVLAESPVLVVR